MRSHGWILAIWMLSAVAGADAADAELFARIQSCRLQPAQMGCANGLNLAAMVVEPEELQRGHTPGAPLAVPMAHAVEKYLTGGKRHLQREDISAAPTTNQDAVGTR